MGASCCAVSDISVLSTKDEAFIKLIDGYVVLESKRKRRRIKVKLWKERV